VANKIATEISPVVVSVSDIVVVVVVVVVAVAVAVAVAAVDVWPTTQASAFGRRQLHDDYRQSTSTFILILVGPSTSMNET
jgi:hypothetical protein